MEAVTLEKLHKDLEENLVQQEVEKIVLETVEEMLHYAQVNKRFVDRLTEKGLWACISERFGNNTLSVSKKDSQAENLILYECGEKLTWQIIREQLARYQLKEEETRIRRKLESHTEDIRKLKEILAFMKSRQMLNFDLWKQISDMESAIKYSQKKENTHV